MLICNTNFHFSSYLYIHSAHEFTINTIYKMLENHWDVKGIRCVTTRPNHFLYFAKNYFQKKKMIETVDVALTKDFKKTARLYA